MNRSTFVPLAPVALLAAALSLVALTTAGAVSSAAREVALVDGDARSVPFGELLDSAADGGARVQIVLFWSLYEPLSRRSLRSLDLYLEDADDGVVAIGVAIPEYREGPDAIAEFARKARVTLPIYLDPDGRLLRALTREASPEERPAPSPATRSADARPELPTTVVLGPDGAVGALLTGEHAATPEALGAAISRAASRTRSHGDSRVREDGDRR